MTVANIESHARTTVRWTAAVIFELSAIAAIKVAILVVALKVASTVGVSRRRTQTHSTTFRKSTTVAVIKLALLVEAALVATTVTHV
jgi:hypothetical protein